MDIERTKRLIELTKADQTLQFDTAIALLEQTLNALEAPPTGPYLTQKPSTSGTVSPSFL